MLHVVLVLDCGGNSHKILALQQLTLAHPIKTSCVVPVLGIPQSSSYPRKPYHLADQHMSETAHLLNPARFTINGDYYSLLEITKAYWRSLE